MELISYKHFRPAPHVEHSLEDLSAVNVTISIIAINRKIVMLNSRTER